MRGVLVWLSGAIFSTGVFLLANGMVWQGVMLLAQSLISGFAFYKPPAKTIASSQN